MTTNLKEISLVQKVFLTCRSIIDLGQFQSGNWRKIALDKPSEGASVWLSELIWRDFYFQILFNFPHINEGHAFKSQFNDLKFDNNPEYFMAWKEGRTGYPIIDAAMRQLNKLVICTIA